MRVYIYMYYLFISCCALCPTSISIQKKGKGIGNRTELNAKKTCIKNLMKPSSLKSPKIKWSSTKNNKLSGGWTNPIGKIWSSKLGSSSPIFGVNIPKIFELPPPGKISKNSGCFPPTHPILTGFSIIFTIHFGVFPYFWKHPPVRKKPKKKNIPTFATAFLYIRTTSTTSRRIGSFWGRWRSRHLPPTKC